jgi:uncharacterized HAD superfamily protein
MKKHAVVDIDDTIASLHPVINALCNDAVGFDLAAADWHTYDAKELYGISNECYTNMLIDNRTLQDVHPIGRAMKTLLMMEEHGYTINYVTARGWHPDAKALTKTWLKKWNFPDGKLHVVPLYECKAQYSESKIATLAAMVVDDSATHIKQFVHRRAANKIFLIDRPWNRKYKELDHLRISHISEVLKHI